MRALVTGASGFLGGHLCRKLIAEGSEVTTVVRDLKAYAPIYEEVAGECNEVHGDIVVLKLLERSIAEYAIDTVFHLAAQTEVGTATKDPIGTFETNIAGTWNVLEACRRQGVKRLIVASSDKAYGSGEVPYKETQHLAWGSPYETSKACGDMLAQSYSETYGMSIAVTRCGNLYGPGHINWTTIIPGTIRSVLRGERPIIRSDGKHKRDYLYVEDAVEGYVKLANGEWKGAFNFGTEKPTSVLEVVAKVIEVMGAETWPDIQNSCKGEIRDQWLDCTLAKSALRWEPKYSLKEGLKKTVEWYREFLT